VRLGSVIVNSAPAPGCEVASIVPPCASTTFFAIASRARCPTAFEL
jgi:hypothetical protein